MKPIIFLYPPYEGKIYYQPRPPFPIGPLYIGAFLESKGIKSRVMDFSYPPDKHSTTRPEKLDTKQPSYFRFGWTDLNIRKWLRKNLYKYNDIVGISSMMSSNYTGTYRLINIVRQVKPEACIVVGGPHATYYPQHIKKNTDVDYIFCGESELSFYRFLKGKIKDKIIPFELVSEDDLNKLPFPKKHLLLDDRETREMYITFTRGCPHRCSFCASHLMQGRRWRAKSVDRVIEEIRFYHEVWGAKKFLVEDDNPCPGNKGMRYLQEICKRIISDLPKLKFEIVHGVPMYISAHKGMADLMWDAGFRDMCFPLESSNPETLKDMNKKFTIENWKAAMKNWGKYEKYRPTTIILGYPFVDTIYTMIKTMVDVTSNYSWVSGQYFRSYHGTPIFKRCVEAGYLTEDYDPINTQNFYLTTERFDLNDLRELMQLARGMKFAIEKDRCNIFSKKDYIPKTFKTFKIPKRAGDIVATGNFGYRRNQNVCAAILVKRLSNFNGKPQIVFKGKNELVFNGIQRSKVFHELGKVLKDMKIK